MGGIKSTANAVQGAVKTVVKKGAKNSADDVAKAGVGVADDVAKAVPGTPEKANKFFGGNTAQGLPQAGMLDRALAVGSIGAIPLSLAPIFMPNADTRAVQAMRTEDKIREARGLNQLAATPQLIAEKAKEAQNMATNTINSMGTRVTVPNTNMLLPGELPPNSLR